MTITHHIKPVIRPNNFRQFTTLFSAENKKKYMNNFLIIHMLTFWLIPVSDVLVEIMSSKSDRVSAEP